MVAAATLTMFLCSSCYHTAIQTRASSDGEHESHQWFLLWGAARVSDPPGQECSDGLAYAESRLGVGDIAIGVLIGLATTGAIYWACGDNNACKTGSFGAGGYLGTFVGTRTVTYGCRRGYSVPPARPQPRVLTPEPETAPPVHQTATASAPRSKTDACMESDFCTKYGRCVHDGKRCVATTDAGCKQSLTCQVSGKCTARNGECVGK